MTRLGALPAGLGEDELVRVVRDALARHVPHGARAGLAVSGGPDSVALAHLAVRARDDVAWTVVHVRHGLRDDAGDAAAAAAVAAALGLAYDERRATVRRASRQGIEAPARDARYGALRAAAGERRLLAVCLAHTADDRAETVVLNLARGTGTRGLAGMPAARRDGDVVFVRPLLRVRRADVRAVAGTSGLAHLHDPTNDDLRLRRTRARREVLPALGRLSGGPGDPVGVLARLADLAAADADALDDLARGHAAASVVAWGPARAIRTEALALLPRALATRLVRLVLAEVRGGAAGLSAEDVHAVADLAPGKAHTVAGGVLATCGQGWLAAAPRRSEPLPSRPLADGGATALPELGLRLVVGPSVGSADAVVPPTSPRVPPGPSSARVHAGARLVVRGARRGERMRTDRGDAGVAALLAGAGVPRVARALVPLLVDERDEPLWIPGVAARPGLQGDARCWLAPLGTPRYARPRPSVAGPSLPAGGGNRPL